MKTPILTRRSLLRGGAATGSALLLGGCDAFDFLTDRDNAVRDFVEGANDLTQSAQRLLLGRQALAQEFTERDIRQPMRPNGTTMPRDEEYQVHAASNFGNYRLDVGGMVENPMSLSLADLRALPSRTQITRHDCVEGWSCIAKWKGAKFSEVVDRVQPKPGVKYVVFNCFDTYGSGSSKYYESIDMVDARHPQTILAYDLNDQALPISNGAPVRMRVERQLGYKMAKYVKSITFADSLGPFGRGKGGYWPDRGYDWYAGI